MKFRYTFAALACSVIVVSLFSIDASAQTYSRLSSTSKYACINAQGKKNHIGIATRTGYKVSTFEAAASDLKGLSRKFSDDVSRLTKDAEEFKDNRQLKNALKSFDSVVRALTASRGKDFKSPEQRLIEINSLKQILRGKIADIKAQLVALQNCKDNKKPAFFTAQYHVLQGKKAFLGSPNPLTTEVIVALEVSAILVKPGAVYCLHLPVAVEPITRVPFDPPVANLTFTSDPCNPFDLNVASCPLPADFLGAYVDGIDDGIPISVDEIQATEGVLSESFNGTATLTMITAKTPCK